MQHRAAPSPPPARSSRPTPASCALLFASFVAGVAAPAGADDDAGPPAALGCFVRHYGGVARRSVDGRWQASFADGAVVVPWDDGRTKSLDERLDDPDVEDILALGYPRGPVAPVVVADFDPGRVRHEGVLRARYGADAGAVAAALVDVDFVGQRVRVHRLVAPALARVAARLSALVAREPSMRRFVVGELGGTMQWRAIAGTQRLSTHAFGTAIDVVTSTSDYWRWQRGADGSVRWRNRIPADVVAAFEAEGFIWGGRWFHYDTMHFEYRPELFDEECRAPPRSHGPSRR